MARASFPRNAFFRITGKPSWPRKVSKYFLMTLSMPTGRDGNGPDGRRIFFRSASQKHRGQSTNRLRVEGESFILSLFFFLATGISVARKLLGQNISSFHSQRNYLLKK